MSNTVPFHAPHPPFQCDACVIGRGVITKRSTPSRVPGSPVLAGAAFMLRNVPRGRTPTRTVALV